MTLDVSADSAVFVNDFSETVRFRTNRDAEARSVSMVVNRQPIEEDDAQPHHGHRAPVLHCTAQNDGTKGVTPDEVENNVSEVEIAFPLGATARWRRINRVLRQNKGAVLLEVMA